MGRYDYPPVDSSTAKVIDFRGISNTTIGRCPLSDNTLIVDIQDKIEKDELNRFVRDIIDVSGMNVILTSGNLRFAPE